MDLIHHRGAKKLKMVPLNQPQTGIISFGDLHSHGKSWFNLFLYSKAAPISSFECVCVSCVCVQNLFRPLLGKVGGWNLVCWLYSQIWDQPRCYGRTVTTPRMVTIRLQPFLLYMNLALKNSYQTGIWLSNIISGWEFGIETYLDGRQPWRIFREF